MSKLVEMLADVYPYCKGDVVNLAKDELARVQAEAKNRSVEAFRDFENVVKADVKAAVSKAEAEVKAEVAKPAKKQ